MDKIHVLFVCLGNICRSPLAEHLFIKHLKQKNIYQNFHVESCGTGNWHVGENADSRTRLNASKNGLKFTHSARQLNQEDANIFDYILVMDHNNLKDVKAVLNDCNSINLLTHFSDDHKNDIIPDPYYGTEKDFDFVFQLLNKTTLELANKLEQLHLCK